MIESDRIKFIESIINKIIPPADIKMPTKDSDKFIRQKQHESHNQFDIDYKLNYGDLVPLFEGVEKKQIEALKIQLQDIKISKHITTQNSISLLPIFEIFPVHLQLTGRIY